MSCGVGLGGKQRPKNSMWGQQGAGTECHRTIRVHLTQAGLQQSGISFGHLGIFELAAAKWWLFWHCVSSCLAWAHRAGWGIGKGVATPLSFPPWITFGGFCSWRGRATASCPSAGRCHPSHLP